VCSSDLNFFLIGDGTSGVGPDRKPLAPCVNIAAAKQADAVLAWVLSKNGGESQAE
jgi:sulfur carrier protein ThiS adenylyltransferase